MFPKQIDIKFYYHQIDQSTIKLINVDVEMSAYTDISTTEDSILAYSVIVSIIPYSHTDLLIQFAISWTVYLIIYVGIGCMSVFMVSIFFAYNYIFSYLMFRYIGKKTCPTFYFKKYFFLSYPPILKGTLLAVSAISIYITILGILFSGHIL